MPIRPDLPAQPALGTPLAPTHESPETLRLLALRRSTPVAMLSEPGPSRADLDMLLRLAARVPDHRKLEPWRFIVFDGAARTRLGDIFAEVARANTPGASLAQIEAERASALRAPAIVTVISSPVADPKQTPVWEQELSAGAVCQNLMIAAQAAGWAACWITEWPAFDRTVATRLGLSAGERIAGFIYLGTAKEQPVERQRPEPGARTTYWPQD